MTEARKPLVLSGGLIVDPGMHGEPAVADVVIGADGVILDIALAAPRPPGCEVIDATGCLVLPGFVDAHRHAWMPAIRGVNGDDSLAGYVRKTRNLVMPHYTPDDVYVGTLIGYWDALDAGVTSIVDFSHCMNSAEHVTAGLQAVCDAPARVQFAAGLNDVPTKTGGFSSLQERISDIRARMQGTDLPDRARLWVSLSDTTQAGPQRLIDEVRAVRELGLPMTLHGRTKMLQRQRSEVAALADEGLLGDDLLWAHLTQATADELQQIADSGGRFVAAPEDELQMGMGWPKIREWEALGGHPGLGVSVVTASSGDLFGAMRLALQSMRALDHEEEMARTGSWPQSVRLRAEDAVRWATADGAHAALLGNVVGSLTPGRRGDVVVLQPGFSAQPVNNPWTTVVVQSSRGDVRDVVVDGVVVKRDGRLLADTEQMLSRLRESHERILAGVGAAGGWDREVELPR